MPQSCPECDRLWARYRIAVKARFKALCDHEIALQQRDYPKADDLAFHANDLRAQCEAIERAIKSHEVSHAQPKTMGSGGSVIS